MTTTACEGPSAIEQADPAATTLYRVAICAFTYYPGKSKDDAGYSIDEDVAWCVAPLASLAPDRIVELGGEIRTLIADPGADRRGFLATIAELFGD